MSFKCTIFFNYLIIFLLIIIDLLCMFLITERNINTYYNYTSYDYNIVYRYLTKEYINLYPYYSEDKSTDYYMGIINDTLNFNNYIYKEVEFKNDCVGKAFTPFYIIYIEKDLDGFNYCRTLTHEILHHKLMISQENYVCSQTFKTMYESDYDYLHFYGIVYALKHMDNKYRSSYNCTPYIIKYFKEVQPII